MNSPIASTSEFPGPRMVTIRSARIAVALRMIPSLAVWRSAASGDRSRSTLPFGLTAKILVTLSFGLFALALAPRTAAQPSGYALDFSPAYNNYVSVNLTAPPASNYTLTAWVKLRTGGINAGSWDGTGKDFSFSSTVRLGENGVRGYDGLLDNFQLWTNTLSAAQVLSNVKQKLTSNPFS